VKGLSLKRQSKVGSKVVSFKGRRSNVFLWWRVRCKLGPGSVNQVRWFRGFSKLGTPNLPLGQLHPPGEGLSEAR